MTFDFKANYILEDETVCLRPLEISDFDYLLEYSINEPEIWKFNANGPIGADNLTQYISHAIKQREEKKEYPFIVYDKATGKYVGSTRFYDIKTDNKTLQLGFTWYGKKYQSTGLNKHCKYLLFQFAFENMGMERVEFRANNANEKSIRAMKSIGCTVEGVLRNVAFNPEGERIDAIVLSVLKQEWETNVKQMLKAKLTNYTL